MKYALALLLLCLLSQPIQADRIEEITIAADFWCPFNCQPNSSHPGYMIEIAQRVFSQHNIKVTYQIIPWSRALKLCRAGHITAVVGGYKSDAPDFIYPENEQGSIGFSFFNLAENRWTYQGEKSLEPLLLAIAYDYVYSAELGQYIKKYQSDNEKIHISYGDQPLKENMQLLTQGLVDVLVETEPVFWYASQQVNSQALFRQAGQVQQAIPAFIAFSPKQVAAKRYARLLSQGMEQLRASGELAEILAKYGLTDWR